MHLINPPSAILQYHSTPTAGISIMPVVFEPLLWLFSSLHLTGQVRTLTGGHSEVIAGQRSLVGRAAVVSDPAFQVERQRSIGGDPLAIILPGNMDVRASRLPALARGMPNRVASF